MCARALKQGVPAINATPDTPTQLKWSPAEIPPQTGKLAIVTGSTSGIGFETAIALAQAGADLVITGPHESEGHWAVGRIRPLAPASLIRFEVLDLANLSAIDSFTRRVERLERPVDLLVNNAGVMALKTRQVTVDGFEMQFATNYLGHFALTGRLLALLRRGRDPRVVQVGGVSHHLAKIDFDDLQQARRYRPTRAYCQSKLALLLFGLELQRRSDAGKWGLWSLAAHPGYARTALFENGPGPTSVLYRVHESLANLFGHSASSGALPILYAATDPGARPGAYYGPKGILELAGPSGSAVLGKRARDSDVARRLWEISEQLTGVIWSQTSKETSSEQEAHPAGDDQKLHQPAGRVASNEHAMKLDEGCVGQE